MVFYNEFITKMSMEPCMGWNEATKAACHKPSGGGRGGKAVVAMASLGSKC